SRPNAGSRFLSACRPFSAYTPGADFRCAPTVTRRCPMANPPSRKSTWRDAVAPASSARPVEEAWRTAQRPSARQRTHWRRDRRARLPCVTPALWAVPVALIVVAFFLRPPKPMHLVLIGAGYEDNLAVPPNAAGRKGLEGLTRLAEQNKNWGGQLTSV